MHGSARARARRAKASRGRVVAAATAAIGAALVAAIFAVAAITHRADASAPPGNPASTTPMAEGSHAGSLVLNDTGADLASWRSSSTCTSNGYSADGAVTTGSGGDVLLTTTGQDDSCAALASPRAYSSAVIEAEIDLPPYPGRSDTLANWDAFWLTNPPRWPEDGELDAVETEPPSGVNGVSWHSGTGAGTASYNVSTRARTLPVDGANLTPGWHIVDVVYTKGYFAVYYDGSLYTSFTSSNVTGDPLTIYFTTDVYPQAQNADSNPATLTVRYLKIWAYR